MDIFDLGTEATVFIIVTILFIYYAIGFLSKRRAVLHYEKRNLFSPAEKNFFYALERAIGFKYRIFAKVRIADVIAPKKGMDKKRWHKHFWQISSKHFDYVLVDKGSLAVVCVIELNDSSHNRKDRSQRDVLVNRVCTSANMPLVWVRATRSYDTAKIKEQIDEVIALQYQKV